MALDRNNRQLPYVSGRMIAIIEHYAKSKFGPGTLSTMFTHPYQGLEVWGRYIDPYDEFYQDLQNVTLPVTMPNKVAESQAWVGYYHQKNAYDDTTRGGYRPGSGRPANDRSIPLSVRISPESNEKLKKVENKSAIIDELIKQHL